MSEQASNFSIGLSTPGGSYLVHPLSIFRSGSIQTCYVDHGVLSSIVCAENYMVSREDASNTYRLHIIQTIVRILHKLQ